MYRARFMQKQQGVTIDSAANGKDRIARSVVADSASGGHHRGCSARVRSVENSGRGGDPLIASRRSWAKAVAERNVGSGGAASCRRALGLQAAGRLRLGDACRATKVRNRRTRSFMQWVQRCAASSRDSRSPWLRRLVREHGMRWGPAVVR